MKASVVITVFNRREEIRKCIDSLKNQDYPKEDYEIIVVDDGSTEDLSFLKTIEGVKYHKQENQGPAAGRNRGTQLSEGEIVLFTDSDCTHDKNWIKEMVTSFEVNIGCVGGGTIDQKDGRFFDLIIKEDKKREKPYFPTKNVAYLKVVLNEIGGFDTRFDRPGSEDVDLCLRVQRKGYKIKRNENAIVYHHHKNTFKGRIKQSFNFGFSDVMFMLIYPSKKRFRPFYIFYIPLLNFKETIKQIKFNFLLFPVIYFFNTILSYSNISGKIYHAFKKGKYNLIWYVPVHTV